MSGIWLGDFPVEYQTASIPRYRGAVARPIVIEGIGPRYSEIKTFVLGLQGKPTDLIACGPAQPGGQPGEEWVTMKGIFIERLIRRSAAAWTIIAYDRRILLASRVADQNYRMKFGQDYLTGTDHSTYKAALVALCDSVDVLKASLDSSAFNLLVPVPLEDNTAPAGQSLPEVIDYLTDRGGCDLDVTLDSKFTFADRGDIDKAQIIQATSGLPWVHQPGFLSLENIVTNKPKRIYGFYWERHCHALKGYDPEATVSTNVPAELYMELEQVYVENGVYYTLEELLAAFNYDGAVSDATIARTIMGNFQGTDLEDDGSDDNLRVRAALIDGWRRLWRVKFPKAGGNIGGWTDFVFGQLNADGSVSETAVNCRWVEMLSVIEAGEDRKYVGSDATRNHEAPAPFSVTWDGGPETGVIRLVQRQLNDKDNIAIPGELEEALKVGVKNTVEDGAGISENLKNLKVIEVEDRAKAHFKTSFEVTVYIVATRRLPNTEDKWWLEDVAGFSDGDVDRVELPVPAELMCLRDYVDPANGKNDAGDGFGSVLNTQALEDDAKRRAGMWKLLHTAELDGDGLSESVFGFRDVRIQGPIKEISLECDGPKIQTRIVAGNLGNEVSRSKTLIARQNARRQATKGLQVVA